MEPTNKKTDKLSSDYVPVDCAIYASYERAILEKRRLKVCWIDKRAQHHIETLRPYDLRTRRHSEFLLAFNQNGQRRILRLDRIANSTVIK
jgi:Rho-binding antiterminator